jgi:predicted solute-binding protein
MNLFWYQLVLVLVLLREFDISLVPVFAILIFLYMPRTGVTAFPTVLSMLLQTVKFIAKKSKCASSAQETGFSPTKVVQLAVACRR